MKTKVLNSLIFLIIICGCNNNKNHRVLYYPDGKIQSEFDTLPNGNIDGTKLDYYPSGELWSKAQWDNGFLNGETFIYYKNGQVQEQSYFVMHKRYGVATEYDSLGVMTNKWDFVLMYPNKRWLYLSEEELLTFDRYEEGKEGIINGHYVYTDGNLNLDSSWFCVVEAENTHIKLGDSLHIYVYVNPAFKDVENSVFMSRTFDSNKNEVVKTREEYNSSITLLYDRDKKSILPTKRGSGYIYGVIHERRKDDSGGCEYVFKQEYFVE